MKASIVDLRYKMNEILKALDRREKVEVLYHGKVKGTIIPHMNDPEKKVKDHAFFGINRSGKSVDEEMEKLRGPRHDAF